MRHVLVTLALVLGGCHAQSITAAPGCNESDLARVYAPVTWRVDVLFVVDDSPAMAPFQTQLEASLPPELARIITQPSQPPTSWHVGVLTADLADGGAVRWIDGAQVSDELTTLLHSDDTGSPDVEPLESAYRALYDGPASASGFLRNDASLAVIFISANDDAGTFDLSRYFRFFATPAAQGGIKVSPYDVFQSAITPPSATRVRTVVNAAHVQSVVDINAADWRPALAVLEPIMTGYLPIPCANQLVPDPTHPDCVAVDVTTFPDGTIMQRIVPPCSTSAPDCWQLVPEPRCAFLPGPALRFDVVRATEAPQYTETTFDCSHPCR